RAVKGIVVSIFAVLCLLTLTWTKNVASSPGIDTGGDGLEAWGKIATVLQHPRCLNCHQLVSPLQGDSRRPHIPHVVRGRMNTGVPGMRCQTCHNKSGNNVTSRTPGAPGWH